MDIEDEIIEVENKIAEMIKKLEHTTGIITSNILVRREKFINDRPTTADGYKIDVLIIPMEKQ